MGFVVACRNVLKDDLSYVYKENMIEKNIGEDYGSQNMSIKILIKDKEVCDFCKRDTKRISFILEGLIKDKKISYQIS
ncbi:plasmid partition family protein [Borreliella andersonii]|uniref:plasmid partition family protein n=1 Tax=Borrelia andersonii TaxID=42109 RepID=UPI003AB3A97D